MTHEQFKRIWIPLSSSFYNVALQLLEHVKNTDLSISKIAERTFYGTEAYFYTAFKKKYGMTPLQYRREAKLFKG